MNSRNMDQLIEKYKREMLSYRDRSSIPYEPEAEINTAENSDTAPTLSQVSETSQAGAIDDYSKESSQSVMSEQANDEWLETSKPVYDATQVSQSAEEPAVRVSARVSNGDNKKDVSAPKINFDDLREECRKIAAGDMEATAERKKSCAELSKYLEHNSKTGKMQVETYKADRAFGVPNARVIVFIPLESGNVTIFDGMTNIDGNTEHFNLPAPPKELSLDPEKSANGNSYAGYTVLVEHPNYVRSVFFNVPVFEGIESIQQVRMVPSDEPNIPSEIDVTEAEPGVLQ